jgi:eukaryotic-like serine/threonine-protein kinase
MRQIGPYQILDLLGKGGMGEVYLAEDIRLGRRVALKLLPPELTNDESRVLRFQQEARTASALSHPNILTIFDIGEVDSTHFIATEFVKGETLRDRMSATRMSVQKMLNIVIQVASALGAAHEVGVVHRDIKPENIMVRPDGLVKVLDFGIAKLSQSIATGGKSEMGLLPLVNTEPGMMMGTPKYMSPEQVRGLDVDERTDIFSLGVVLYEMVTGAAPFEGATISDTIAAILQNEPPPITQYAQTPTVPAGLQQIVVKALCKDRDGRYQTMGDLVGDLRSIGRKAEIDQQSILQLWSGEAPIPGAVTELATNPPREVLEARSSATGATRTTSSAEYIVSEIRLHKRGSALIMVLLLAAVAVLAYLLYSASGGKAPIKSVAVLPFDNASNDPDMEYLSDGISESLIDSLSGLSQLKVTARSSSFKYNGKGVDLQAVATALDVQAIVTGRVMLRGDTLQVSADLVDMRDKTQMWGDQYNRKKTDLLAVQSEISQQIAEKLRLRLTNAEQRQIVKEAKADPLAYELVLEGRFHGRKATPEGLKKQVEYCNKAIEVDPNYALGYAGLADAYRLLSYPFDPTEAAKAEVAAQRALQLDDTLSEVHYVLAQLRGNSWDWVGAERENKRAIELNPSLANAHAGYAVYLDDIGRHEEAFAEMERARELDPLNISVIVFEGAILSNMRQYDQAIAQYKRALDLDQSVPTTHEYLGYSYSMKQMYAEAIAEYKEAIRLEGDITSIQSYMGYALAMSGKRKQALTILDELKSTKEPVSQAELAVLYVGLGDKQQALASLEKAFDQHDLQLQYLKVEPHYDSLRSDPRFADLVRKVGLTP